MTKILSGLRSSKPGFELTMHDFADEARTCDDKRGTCLELRGIMFVLRAEVRQRDGCSYKISTPEGWLIPSRNYALEAQTAWKNQTHDRGVSQGLWLRQDRFHHLHNIPDLITAATLLWGGYHVSMLLRLVATNEMLCQWIACTGKKFLPVFSLWVTVEESGFQVVYPAFLSVHERHVHCWFEAQFS